MTNTEFRAALEVLGLSQRKTALIFGVNERTVRRWARGESRIQVGVHLALLTWVAHQINPFDLFEPA